jgi:Leucine-rich repeat (LRR) protein
VILPTAASCLPACLQLSRLELLDCQLGAVAAVPWQEVLPRLPALHVVAVERCSGAVLLPGLWRGLAGCSQLLSLTITGSNSGTSGAGRESASATSPHAVLEELFLPFPAAAGMQPWQGQQPAKQQRPQHQQQQVPRQQWGSIPDCIAALRQLRTLNLSNNGLHALPDALAWCQQLTSVDLSGNRCAGLADRAVRVVCLVRCRPLLLTSIAACS